MKLRNKKTGEIKDFYLTTVDDNNFHDDYYCESLKEFIEEWEDYEEPKVHWYIYGAEPLEIDEGNWDKDFVDELKSIGNYFKTKEKAEKAVERLRAWKRLKDKKAKIVGWCYSFDVDLDGGGCEFNGDDIIVGIDTGECDVNDLDLLFGGD